MANIKPLVFSQTPEGCFVVTSHKLNHDGYFRKGYIDGFHEMFHRTIWRLNKGEIPEGYEVHHVCNNRACCNIQHLELVTITDHKVQSNTDRYADLRAKAKAYWERTKCTGTALATQFMRTPSTGCRWVRLWETQSC